MAQINSQTKVTMVYSPEAVAALGALRDVQENGANGAFGQHLIRSLNSTGERAAKYLRLLIKKELYLKPYYILKGGSVTQGPTHRFLNAARYTGVKIVNKKTIEAGIFDLDAASGMKVNKKRGSGYYFDVLEEGHAPYQMNDRQRRAWFVILKKIKEYDPNMATAMGSQIIGEDGTLHAIRGFMHPGIRPYKFFERAMNNWDSMITQKGNEFMSFIQSNPQSSITRTTIQKTGIQKSEYLFPNIKVTFMKGWGQR